VMPGMAMRRMKRRSAPFGTTTVRSKMPDAILIWTTTCRCSGVVDSYPCIMVRPVKVKALCLAAGEQLAADRPPTCMRRRRRCCRPWRPAQRSRQRPSRTAQSSAQRQYITIESLIPTYSCLKSHPSQGSGQLDSIVARRRRDSSFRHASNSRWLLW
jgi:hypothetical protein